MVRWNQQQQVKLTEETVLAALEAHRSGLSAGLQSSEHLVYLGAVDAVLKANFAGDGSYRVLALGQFLSSQTLGLINSVLRNCSDTQLSVDSSKSELLSLLENIPEGYSKFLLGALWIYMHYCRFDLAMERNAFCTGAAIDKRTLYRYQNYAVRKLTDSIIQTELDIWRRHHKTHLHLLCTYQEENTYSSIYKTLSDDIVNKFKNPASQHNCIAIYGPASSGKTFLTSQIAHHLIDGDIVDDIIWVQSPVSINDVVSRIGGSGVEEEESKYQYSDWHMLVIIDDADRLLNEWPHDPDQTFRRNGCLSFLMTMRCQPPEHVKQSFYLYPVSRSMRITQHRHNQGQSSYALFPSYDKQLEPLAMPLYFVRNKAANLSLNSLGSVHKVVLVALVLMPDGTCSKFELEHILPADIVVQLDSIIASLQDIGLLYVSVEASRYENYSVDVGVRTRLMSQVRATSVESFFPVEILAVNSNLPKLRLVESILLNNLPLHSDDTRAGLIDQSLWAALVYRRWPQWSIILEEIYFLSCRMQIVYAVCCIGMGQIRKGYELIQLLLSEMGRKGVFELQETGLLESLLVERILENNGSHLVAHHASDPQASFNKKDWLPRTYIQANVLSKEIVDPSCHAHCVTNLGVFYLDANDPDQGRDCFDTAKNILLKLCNQDLLLVSESNILQLID